MTTKQIDNRFETITDIRYKPIHSKLPILHAILN